MIISHKYKFIFIKTGKIAGTSLEVYLSGICGDNDVLTPIFPKENNHSPRNYKGIWNPLFDMFDETIKGSNVIILKRFLSGEKFDSHMSARTVRRRVPKQVWDDYYKFTIERNPWDKTLSHYFMHKARSNEQLTFEQYLKNGRFAFNFQRYTDVKGDLIVDRVIRYENLNAELQDMFSKLRIPFGEGLSVRAKSGYRKNRASCREFYSKEQRRVIEKLFEREIQMHGYKF